MGAVPSTAFGQPNGNTPSKHRFTKDNQPERDRRTYVKGIIAENGHLAVEIRHRILRAALTVLDDVEALQEGGDAVAASKAALGMLNADMRGLLREAELSAGLTQPQDDDGPLLPAGGTSDEDIRRTAMAALELLRRAASPTYGDDVIEAEVVQE